MNQHTTSESLTILYDGACPLCRREIAHVKGLAERQGDSGLCFVDISLEAEGDTRSAAERAALLARFHVQRADGSRIDGAAAFVAMWQRLPGWRWLAKLARLPGVLTLFEVAYRGFLLVRPLLQRIARQKDTTQSALAPATVSALSVYLERELRSDHAGESGAVAIYQGIAAVAAWRGDDELLNFAF